MQNRCKINRVQKKEERNKEKIEKQEIICCLQIFYINQFNWLQHTIYVPLHKY